MKNLFKYATKELSQDAFLRWLFENYEDQYLGPVVVDFINTFTADQYEPKLRPQLSLKYGDITKLKTCAQKNDIDVTIEFESKAFDGHRYIVIEDKTGSNEHKQLVKYNKKIDDWSFSEGHSSSDSVYKLYYKTQMISEDESQRIKEAGWVQFDIEKINKFFLKYVNFEYSDVLRDYAQNVRDIFDDYKRVSDKPMSEWSFTNWETYFNDLFKGYNHAFFTYHGLYGSLRVYADIKGNKYLTYTAFEIRVRGNLELYFHPGFVVNDKQEWSIKALNLSEEQDGIKTTCENELEELRTYIKNQEDKSLKRANTIKTFARIKDGDIDYQNMSLEDVSNKLLAIVKKFINLIAGFKE